MILRKLARFEAVAVATVICVSLWQLWIAEAFLAPRSLLHHHAVRQQQLVSLPPFASFTALSVSIGLGPDQKQQKDDYETKTVVYEIPNHEEYRQSRRSKLDVACDEWFATLLGADATNSSSFVLGPIAQRVLEQLRAPVPLTNAVELPRTDAEWTPYVSTKLPWSLLSPSYGLETFGVPVPRRNAETWRHFDVAGLVGQEYSLRTQRPRASEESVEETENIELWKKQIKEKGVWLEDDACEGRLVYVNGQFVPQLSKLVANRVYNLANSSSASPELQNYLARITDGFTDELVVPVRNGDTLQRSLQALSGPHHAVGPAYSQFAVNTQQGTACFAALNTIHTQAVAVVTAAADADAEKDGVVRPVLVINAVTPSGDIRSKSVAADSQQGLTLHPRLVVVAEPHARVSVVQSCIDLNDGSSFRPKLYNGYTQFFIHANANVTHSYLEESSGMLTAGTELSDEEAMSLATNATETFLTPRQVEAQRPELRNTHFETLEVQLVGENASHVGTIMSVGGSGRVRIALSASLLQPNCRAEINGFSLSGGLQRTDMKTNIHHIAQGTSSRQVQKNMIGGRATGSFRGRIRVEQSAQQTDSQQLAKTVLLSDKSRAWSVPSLEIIADDVKCSHGSTVSDLSEEELFYLRTRGLSRSMARTLLMYAFAGDISACVDPSMLGSLDGKEGLIKRVSRRLENLVPLGERAIKGEYQSI